MTRILDTTLLASVGLTRTLTARKARLLARQDLVSFADIAARSDAELLGIYEVGPTLLRQLRRQTEALLRDGHLPADAPPSDPWERAETADPRHDVLVLAGALEPAQRARLAAIPVRAAALSPETEATAAIFGCRTLLDVAELPPARIGSVSPATFADLRARIIQALDGALLPAPARAVETKPFRPVGQPVPPSIVVPVALRERLQRIGLVALTLPDGAFEALAGDGLVTGYDLATRDPAALGARYGLDTEALAGLVQSVRRQLALGMSQSMLCALVAGQGAIAAWIGEPDLGDPRPWLDLSKAELARLGQRRVRTGQAGLTARLADRLITARIGTLAALARTPRVQVAGLVETADALATLEMRLLSLARFANSTDTRGGDDVDVLRQEGFGADLCEALARANLPTLGRAHSADLAAVPGIPPELAPSLKRAISTRLKARSTDEQGDTPLLALDPAARDWLKTQPISALDSPGLRRGSIHRLRQAGYADLGAVAEADRQAIAAVWNIGQEGVALIVARIQQILQETPLQRRLDSQRPHSAAA